MTDDPVMQRVADAISAHLRRLDIPTTQEDALAIAAAAVLAFKMGQSNADPQDVVGQGSTVLLEGNLMYWGFTPFRIEEDHRDAYRAAQRRRYGELAEVHFRDVRRVELLAAHEGHEAIARLGALEPEPTGNVVMKDGTRKPRRVW